MLQSQKSLQKIVPILRGLLAACVLTAILLVLLAFALYKLDLGERVLSAGIVFTYLSSCAFGGIKAGHHVGTRKYFWGFLTGLCYFLLLVGLSMAFEPETIEGSKSLLKTLLFCGGGGALGGMFAK